MIRVPSGIACAVALSLSSVAARAQQENAATFYLIVNSDTILVERQTRSATRFDGEFVQRGAGHVKFGATLAPNGLVTKLQVDTRSYSGDTAWKQQTLTWVGDSVRVVGAGGSVTMASAAGGLPWLNPSPTFMEQFLLRARVLGTPTATIPIAATSTLGLSANVAWIGADSATIALGGSFMRFAVSPAGHITGGGIPAQGVRIVRGKAIGPLLPE